MPRRTEWTKRRLRAIWRENREAELSKRREFDSSEEFAHFNSWFSSNGRNCHLWRRSDGEVDFQRLFAFVRHFAHCQLKNIIDSFGVYNCSAHIVIVLSFSRDFNYLISPRIGAISEFLGEFKFIFSNIYLCVFFWTNFNVSILHSFLTFVKYRKKE